MIRLRVRVRSADADTALAALLTLAPDGFEERDVDAEHVDFVLYGEAGALPDQAALRGALGAGTVVDTEQDEVADDWSERWKRWHRPIEIAAGGRRLRVRPPWEPSLGQADLPELIIDPGQAFGTGAHGTTKLCLELMLALEPDPADASFADWGAGSGVLAVAAARLGFGPVHAVDFDPLSVDACLENAEANDVVLEVARHDLVLAGPGPWAPVVAANLLRPLLLAVAGSMVRPPHTLIASGLLMSEADEVADAFRPVGLRETDRLDDGEWAALRLDLQPG